LGREPRVGRVWGHGRRRGGPHRRGLVEKDTISRKGHKVWRILRRERGREKKGGSIYTRVENRMGIRWVDPGGSKFTESGGKSQRVGATVPINRVGAVEGYGHGGGELPSGSPRGRLSILRYGEGRERMGVGKVQKDSSGLPSVS